MEKGNLQSKRKCYQFGDGKLNTISLIVKLAVLTVSVTFLLLIPVFGNTTNALEEDTAYICLKDIREKSDTFGETICGEFDYLDDDVFNDESREKIEMRFGYELDTFVSEVLPK